MSYALNGRPGVSQTTRERILAGAVELGWHVNAQARALAARRAMAIGLVLARPASLLSSDPFFAGLLAGLESVLGPRGHALVLRVLRETDEEAAYVRAARSGQVDGVVLTDLRVDDPRVDLLAHLGLPAVALGDVQPTANVTPVVLDDAAAVRDAVRHLAALGHSRIAHVAGPDRYVHSVSRRRAWRQECQRLGVSPSVVVEGDFTVEGGAAATKRLLDRDDRVTAIVYANDLMALSGVNVLRTRGLEVPRDVSVVGFDGIPLGAHLDPTLTTIVHDPVLWGSEVATELLDQLDGVAPSRRVLPPAQLLVRGSTGPVAT